MCFQVLRFEACAEVFSVILGLLEGSRRHSRRALQGLWVLDFQVIEFRVF